MSTDRQKRFEPLTNRELEILRLIADGLSNQQIADQLFLTLDTIKWFNKQTFQKLGVRSRTQAINLARELSLLDDLASRVKENLPAHNTVFIGRERELSDIQARLADPACHLLTLLGPGGIGKTRLAIEAAQQLIPIYPDGVYFIAFSQVESPLLILRTLADGLGLTLTNERDPLTQIIQYVRAKAMLLVIDNFEHLLEGVNYLADILTKSKAVKLLVTSRERLRLKQEWVFDVHGLHVPPHTNEILSAESPMSYEAGQLFLQTARRVKANFTSDRYEQVHIARICQLVMGMPLGIELAASWVRLLSCAEIARKIEHNLDILTTSWRDVPERHRSMQVVLDHSWSLLSAQEQDVFCRLSVFSGGFSHESAIAVTGTSLPTLLALVDKSFLQLTNNDRFQIHELMKRYGAGKLEANQELWMSTSMNHCRYFAAFLNERMTAVDTGQYLEEIEQVFDDIQVAWHYAVDNGLLTEIELFVAGFLPYYHQHSWYRAGSGALARYQQAISYFNEDTENPSEQTTLAGLYESVGDLHTLANDTEHAIATFEEALKYTADDDHIRCGRLYSRIGDVRVAMIQHDQAHAFYALAESELAQIVQHNPSWWREWFQVKTQQMTLYYWQNRTDEMVSLAAEMQPFIESHATLSRRSQYYLLLAGMAYRRDRYYYSSEAIEYSAQALALSLKAGKLDNIAVCYFTHGFSLLHSFRLNEAEVAFEKARTMSEQSGDLIMLAHTLTNLTIVYRLRGDTDKVNDYAAESIRIATEAKMPQYTGMAQAQYAWCAWRAGDLEETKQRGQAAIADWDSLGLAQSIVSLRWLALFPLVGVALHEEAIHHGIQYARQLLSPDQHRLPDDLTDVLEQAIISWENNQISTARELLQHAVQLAQMIGYL